MIVGLLIPSTCIFFSVFLLFVYFSKPRVHNEENSIYKKLLVVNFITLLLEYVNNYLTFNYIPGVSDIIIRIYLVLLTFFIALMTSYMAIVISHDEKVLKKKDVNLRNRICNCSVLYIFITSKPKNWEIWSIC